MFGQRVPGGEAWRTPESMRAFLREPLGRGGAKMAEADGVFHELCPAVEVELVHDVGTVGLDSIYTTSALTAVLP